MLVYELVGEDLDVVVVDVLEPNPPRETVELDGFDCDEDE